jgi:DNA recombination protein RmuC
MFYLCSNRRATRTMTSAPIAVIDGAPIDLNDALGAALVALAFLLLTLVALMRASAARRRERDIADERQEAIEVRFAALAQSSAELNGRLSGMAEWLGAGIEKQAQRTGENLGKLNERLAVIDAAQARLTEMTREVVSLKDILANKQARGAFGQGRMEAIVRDGLPAGAYDFQFTLSNRARPDCVIRLPATRVCSRSTPSFRSRASPRCAPRATRRRGRRRRRACAPTSAST